MILYFKCIFPEHEKNVYLVSLDCYIDEDDGCNNETVYLGQDLLQTVTDVVQVNIRYYLCGAYSVIGADSFICYVMRLFVYSLCAVV